MGIFDIFRKKQTEEKLSVFDDERYVYALSDFEKQQLLMDQLTEMQKSALLVVLGVFVTTLIKENTYQREYADSLLNHRIKMLGLTYESAVKNVDSSDKIHDVLITIGNRQIIDILLNDLKYLLKLLVPLTMKYRDGVKINQTAISYMYGIFVPIGYTKAEVYDHKDFLMY